MTLQDILRKVRKIELRTRSKSEQWMGGNYHSAFRGKGMSFSEVREYTYNDDVRHIDWNVTARTDHPYIKVYEEERELNIILLIDTSWSTSFGLTSQTKQETIAEAIAVVGFSATLNNDKVSALLFGDKVAQHFPASKEKRSIIQILTASLIAKPPHISSDVNLALRKIMATERRKSIIFILSDFATSNYEKSLKMVAERHDVIGVRVYDPIEASLPRLGLVHVQDPISGESRWIDTDDATLRVSYQKAYDDRVTYCEQAFTSARAQCLAIATIEDAHTRLDGFFKKRSKRT
jgi:uncharacterized protein (DUF58 family)